MSLICQKCLCCRTGDKAGEPCQTPGCGGTIEVAPEFATLVDVLPEPMTCGRRVEHGHHIEGNPFLPGLPSGPNLDRWQKFKAAHGNRVCSYCGSLHPDDMFALVKQAAAVEDGVPYRDAVRIEITGKNYKVYVHQPGVRNAHEGGIKFYMQHLPHKENGDLNLPEGAQEELEIAVRKSRNAFRAII